MSRHTLNSGKYELTYGWDNPLQTFFCQIVDKELEESDNEEDYMRSMILWSGTKYKECEEVDTFLESLEEFFTSKKEKIDEGMKMLLENLRDHKNFIKRQLSEDLKGKSKPTPLQMWVNEMFKN